MNIGMILDETFPPDPRVENEAMSLIRQGYHIFLYCLDYTGRQPAEEEINGIQVRRVHPPRWIYHFSALAYTLPIYHLFLKKSIIRFLKENKIQVVHVHDMRIARSVFWIIKKQKLSVVFDLHENRPEIMKYYGFVRSFPGKWLIFPSVWKRYEYHYINNATRVIVVTEEAKEYYVSETQVDPLKFVVVPNTVRKAFYTRYTLQKNISAKYKKNFVILYLGDTGLRRGLDTAIESLRFLRKQIPEIKLVIVGKSKDDFLLKQIARDAGVEKFVDFVGWVKVNLFPSYILASDVGICPIHKNLHHETTYANKIFQSLAFGKPVVVSDCKAQARFVRENRCGLVFKDNDANDFAKKILKLYGDKSLYRIYSENGVNVIREKFNWENNELVLSNLYNKL